MDRPGNANPHQGLGRGQNPARAERGSPERTHLCHDLKKDVRSRLHPNSRAVSESSQKTEALLQAVLRE